MYCTKKIESKKKDFKSDFLNSNNYNKLVCMHFTTFFLFQILEIWLVIK